MKLLDSLLLSASIGFFIIGLNETFVRTTKNSFSQSYWIFMLSLLCLLLFQIRKVMNQPNNQPEKQPNPKLKAPKNSSTIAKQTTQSIRVRPKKPKK
ncbi:MAG: hypothetical protein NZ551_10440 [Microscillaceae bacterium]|nr:hypothetical protein [Microscillaceae bacterium]MDW8461616.1 hypothetical protein [Cytophagales bacterium]